ncbi:HAUS augmin-like complex subunit 2 [Dreissena polymorpha]|uniref:HAUS augmin-like complex subunit 2 n=1 Tax=Dreissena polymorpha TaxID=45954 RepID=UPI002263F50E|nr:HAUS augmin-like complex subunit 2 [Dreissena polymorpha]
MVATSSQMAESNNPWSTQDKSLTGLKKALMLGERTGHVANKSSSLVLDPEKSTHLPSVKLIQVLKKMSRAQAELNKVNLEIQLRMQDKETRDITHLDVLEARINKIKSLNSHIECVIESKELLNRRLQQPFQGEYLKLEAQHHKFACELFPQITPLLGELSTNLENIVWAKSLKWTDGRLDKLISELSSALGAMQTSFQSYCQIQQSMRQLHGMQSDPLQSTRIDH